jgi:hypothetical protein
VPTSIKLQEELGDDVQVIFVECQNTPRDEWEAYSWSRKWMGNNAMWTIERPIDTTGSGLPEVALIGVDGSVLMQGHPGDLGKKFEEAIAAEVKKSKQAPAGTPKPLEKVWQSFAKGDVAAAIAECDKLGTDEATKARDEFLSRTEKRIGRVKWMIEKGFLSAAEKRVGDLEKSVKGHAELSSKVAEQKSRLDTPELKEEREAEKAFAAFVAKIAKEKPFEPGNVKKAEAFVARDKAPKTAERAERFVTLSKVKIAK